MVAVKGRLGCGEDGNFGILGLGVGDVLFWILIKATRASVSRTVASFLFVLHASKEGELSERSSTRRLIHQT